MIFLSFPYTHEVEAVTKERIEFIKGLILKLSDHRIVGLSPVVYYHDIAVKAGKALDYYAWEPICKEMLNNCTECWVIELNGWQSSVGVSDEIKLAYKNNIIIRYVTVAQCVELSKFIKLTQKNS